MAPVRANGDDEVDPFSLQLYNTLWKEGMRADGIDLASTSRIWLHVDDHGVASEVEVDKHVLVYELGVRYRDLLTLDPSLPLPFPAAILIRERALIVNLESVRMIICANQCYILSVPSDRDPYRAAQPTADSQFVRKLCEMVKPVPKAAPYASTKNLQKLGLFSPHYATNMPYELKALEVALATMTAILEAEVFRLEHRGYPIVDKLTSDVSMPVLNDVREIKSTMNKLLTRVQRLKQELEEILDDDDDMADMYLGHRALSKGEELPLQPRDIWRASSHGSSHGSDRSEALVPLFQPTTAQPQPQRPPPSPSRASPSLRRPSDSGAPPSSTSNHGEAQHTRAPSRVSFQGGEDVESRPGQPSDDGASESGADSASVEQRSNERRAFYDSGGERHHRSPSRSKSRVDPHEIEDAEDQLENYYVKVDAILRRLLMLSEHIDANEDFVEIQMDHRRNELVAIDLFVSLIAAVFGYVAMVGGFWGMNLYNTVWQESYQLFLATCVICGVGAILLFAGFMYIIIKRKLMFITNTV